VCPGEGTANKISKVKDKKEVLTGDVAFNLAILVDGEVER
jgi:hypothetical protein